MDTAADLRRHARDLQKRALDLIERAEILETRPRDRYEDGTVLTFTREGRYGNGSRFKGPLKYAAIKAGNLEACWFLTGLTKSAKTWDQLLAFIGEVNFKTVRTVGWRGLYDPLNLANIGPGFHKYHDGGT